MAMMTDQDKGGFWANLRKEWHTRPGAFVGMCLIFVYGIYGLCRNYLVGETDVWRWVWYVLFLIYCAYYLRRLIAPNREELWADLLYLVALVAHGFVYFTVW